MRLADVHGQKINMIFVVVVNLNDVAHLAAEGRSSKTAKHQYQRACAKAFADVEMIRAIERQQSSVGSVAAYFQCATMHVRQGIAHHAVSVFGAARHVTERAARREEQHGENTRNPFQQTLHVHSTLKPNPQRRSNLALSHGPQKYYFCISGRLLPED